MLTPEDIKKALDIFVQHKYNRNSYKMSTDGVHLCDSVRIDRRNEYRLQCNNALEDVLKEFCILKSSLKELSKMSIKEIESHYGTWDLTSLCYALLRENLFCHKCLYKDVVALDQDLLTEEDYL